MNIMRRLQTWIEQSVSSQQHDESTLKQSRQWAQSITWGLIATTGLSISWLMLARANCNGKGNIGANRLCPRNSNANGRCC